MLLRFMEIPKIGPTIPFKMVSYIHINGRNVYDSLVATRKFRHFLHFDPFFSLFIILWFLIDLQISITCFKSLYALWLGEFQTFKINIITY